MTATRRRLAVTAALATSSARPHPAPDQPGQHPRRGGHRHLRRRGRPARCPSAGPAARSAAGAGRPRRPPIAIDGHRVLGPGQVLQRCRATPATAPAARSPAAGRTQAATTSITSSSPAAARARPSSGASNRSSTRISLLLPATDARVTACGPCQRMPGGPGHRGRSGAAQPGHRHGERAQPVPGEPVQLRTDPLAHRVDHASGPRPGTAGSAPGRTSTVCGVADAGHHLGASPRPRRRRSRPAGARAAACPGTWSAACSTILRSTAGWISSRPRSAAGRRAAGARAAVTGPARGRAAR